MIEASIANSASTAYVDGLLTSDSTVHRVHCFHGFQTWDLQGLASRRRDCRPTPLRDMPRADMAARFRHAPPQARRARSLDRVGPASPSASAECYGIEFL